MYAMERGHDIFSPAGALSVLQWWTDAGVESLVDEEPRDWLRPRTRAAEPAPNAIPLAPADELPSQLDLFHAYLRDSPRLPFVSPSVPRICPSGDPASDLMIMTDMPSDADCTAGTLLSGGAGSLFDKMLAAIGRDRSSIYLTSLSCLRSPGGRFTSETALQCATLARHHIGLVQPKALLLFGDACSKALLGQSMAQARGRWHEVEVYGGQVRTLVTLSPSYLLDQPSAKRLAWADLQMLMEGLK